MDINMRDDIETRIYAIPTQRLLADRGHVGNDEQLDVVEVAAVIAETTQASLELHVVTARKYGATWAQIGVATEMSRQAAWARWRTLDATEQ